MRMSLNLCALALLAGCGSKDSPTWYRDIQPVIDANCARCHNGTGIGPGDFRTYEAAAANSLAMSIFVESGQMPPPTADPTCADYKDSELMNLTDAQRALFTEWYEAGTPLGKVDDAPDKIVGSPPFTADEIDFVFELPRDYTPSPDAAGNDYHCFVLDNPSEQDMLITGYEVAPGNLAVVHHAILFADPLQRADALFGNTGASDFSCDDPVMDLEWQYLVGWAPGGPPTRFDNNVALRIEAGQSVVLQMHYYVDPANPPADQVDRTQLRFRVRDETEDFPRVMSVFPIGPLDFTIPANEVYTLHDTLVNDFEEQAGFEVRGQVHTINPHMHGLGVSYKAWIERVDGSPDVCVMQSERWSFNNQPSYQLREPITVEPGDTLHMECTWDNTASNPNQLFDPPQDVHWGGGSGDEMCFFLSAFTYEPAL